MGKSRGGGRSGKPRNPRPKRAGDPESSSEEESNYKPTQRGLGRQNDTVGMLPPSDDESEEEEEQEADGGAKAAAAAAGSSATSATAAAAAAAAAARGSSSGGAAAPKGSVAPVSAAAKAPPLGQRRGAAAQDDDSSDDDDSSEDDDDSDEDDDSSEDDGKGRPAPGKKPGGSAATGEAPRTVPQVHYLSQPSAPRTREATTVERSPEEIAKEKERLEMIRKKREADRARRIQEEGWDRYAPMSDTNRPPGYVPSDHPSIKGQ